MNARNFIKKVWGTDRSTRFKVGAWLSAVVLWQLIDKDHSILHSAYNEYKYKQGLQRSKEAVQQRGGRADMLKIQEELNRSDDRPKT